jgi:hypothetical protein
MADFERLATPADAEMAALFWWRGDQAKPAASAEAAPPNERLVAFAGRARPALPRRLDLPGNRLKANAAARRARTAKIVAEIALERDVVAAIRGERRNALLAVAIALVATAAPVAAAIYAAMMQAPVALGLAVAGGCAASCALYHAARWFLLTRADAPPNFLA